MKMPDGGRRPTYTLQVVSDTTTGLIAGIAVETSGSDMGPMDDALEAAFAARATTSPTGDSARLNDIRILAERA
jgi:hypothetical protein